MSEDFDKLTLQGGINRFGTPDSYSEFEPDGTLKFVGSAESWIDIDFPLIPRTVGAGLPAYAIVQGNLQMPRWQVDDALTCEVQELIHSWAEGTAVYFHVHVVTGGTNVNDRFLRFEIEYTWANFGATLPANTVVTTSDLTIPANTPALTHLIFPLTNFVPAGGRIGGHVLARLKRVASVGAAPGNNPFIGMMQLHIQQDTTGSREMTSK